MMSTIPRTCGTVAIFVTLLAPPALLAHREGRSSEREREGWEDHDEALEWAHRGRFHQALDEIDDALEELPDEPRFHLTRGLILLDLGRESQAVRHLEIARDTGEGQVNQEAIDELVYIGRMDPPGRSGRGRGSAAGSSTTTSPASPGSGAAPAGASTTGTNRVRVKIVEPAGSPGSRRTRDLSTDGGRAWSHYERGRAMANHGHLEDALRPLDRAIELEPDEARFRLTRGLVHLDLGNFDLAVADLEVARDRGTGRVREQASDELETCARVGSE